MNIDLKDITSLLRIRLKSDRIEDVLDDIALQGVGTLQSATYDTPLGVLRMDVSHGTLSHLVNCMLNNGMAHDFHLIPVEEPCEATLTVTVNGTPHRVTTLLPPLRDGSITELYLMLHQGKLTVGSSWVDTKFAFSPIRTYRNDSIRVGDFLQKDGSCSAFRNEESIALVIESNGRHGKAVALKDNEKVSLTGKNRFCTGRLFETVDGKRKEGSYKPKANSKATPKETEEEPPRLHAQSSPSNQIAVEDIKRVQGVIAREGKQLVYTHYNLIVCCDRLFHVQGAPGTIGGYTAAHPLHRPSGRAHGHRHHRQGAEHQEGQLPLADKQQIRNLSCILL
jgi:hypothetical protein